MKFKHISKNQVFKNDVITVFEETLALPNDNVVTWTFTGKKEVVAIIAELENEIFFVKQYRPAIKKELIDYENYYDLELKRDTEMTKEKVKEVAEDELFTFV